MNKRFWIRTTTTAAALFFVAIGPFIPTAQAQDEAINGLFTVEKRERAPDQGAVYGYFVAGLFAAGGLFAVCKSSRR